VVADSDAEATVDALVAGVRMLVRRMRQLQTDGELGMRQVSTLKRLEQDGPITSSALARLEEVTPQAMGATVSELDRRGLITREIDPSDGRRVLLALSDTGRALLRERRDTYVQRLATAVTAEFTPAEQERLEEAARLLQRLARTL
jgi:DNA-binding MarR family transcriptional regulator